VESCCIFGDQCLSNGVCQILPTENNRQNVSYYGAVPLSTFFMVEPSNFPKSLILSSTEPSTAQAQYIPTQWEYQQLNLVPSRRHSCLTRVSPQFPVLRSAESPIALRGRAFPHLRLRQLLAIITGSASDKIAVGVGLGIGIPSLIVACVSAYFGYLPTTPKFGLRSIVDIVDEAMPCSIWDSGTAVGYEFRDR
jgi:hypothetical protein